MVAARKAGSKPWFSRCRAQRSQARHPAFLGLNPPCLNVSNFTNNISNLNIVQLTFYWILPMFGHWPVAKVTRMTPTFQGRGHTGKSVVRAADGVPET